MEEVLTSVAKKNKRLNIALESEISGEFYDELTNYVDSIE